MTILFAGWVVASARELGALGVGRREKIRVAGDSMDPHLCDDEVVLIDSSTLAKPGNIVVCGHPFKNLEVIKFLVSTEDGFAELWSPSGDHSGQFGRPPLSNVRGVVRFNLSRRRPVPVELPAEFRRSA